MLVTFLFGYVFCLLGFVTITQATLMKSFSSAEALAELYPQYASAITAGARSSFLDGAGWAYLAGMVAVVVGGAIVFFLFPKKEDERGLLAE